MKEFEFIGTPLHANWARRTAGVFIAGIRFVGKQLAAADLNPHEGRLRASNMPVGYMRIPDAPPADPTKSELI